MKKFVMKNKKFLIERSQPVYDKNGNVKYYKNDDYIYVRHNGELLDIE